MNIINSDNTIKIKSKFYIYPLSISLALCFATMVSAAPTGGTIAAGNSNINYLGNTTTVTQSTQKAIINWQGFNVGANESVRFAQPNSSSIILNRIIGADASHILGSISANGKVFLINPNGILFGAGSQVNVGGMIASTLGISDANFMAGNYQFAHNNSASITNQGALSTNIDGGYIALLGANINNQGLINARLGTVALAAGNAITLDIAGDNLLNVKIDQGAINALVNNGSIIMADGGQVLMTARGAGNLLSNAVNNTGIVQAQSIQNKNGTIILSAGNESGVVNVSGTLDVSGSQQTAGKVQLLGNKVNLVNANINASGDYGGGEVLVGGNFRGSGPQPNAQFTSMDSVSVINANANLSGNGGRIALWSENTTTVAGALNAQGGSQTGNGGYIETSGNQLKLSNTASINTKAPNGKMGTWLLDPTNWTIATTGGDETPAQVETSLASTNRTITATNDINVNNAITWSTPQALTLDAGHDVNINGVITASTAGAKVILIGGNNVNINEVITASGAGNQINVTATNNVFIKDAMTSSGAGNQINITATNGDITVTPHTLGAALPAITASGLDTQVNITAGQDITLGTVTTDGGGSMVLRANRNVNVDTATAGASPGTVSLYADNDGTGPGVAGGTVNIGTTVTATNTIVRFNPVSYSTAGAEITAYAAKIVGGKDIKAWVFATGVDKVYDQTTAATLKFKGNPTDAYAVTLNGGTATFDNKNVGDGKTVTYTGATLGGTTTDLALFASTGTTTANITPAPLTVTATGSDKVYDGNTTAVVALSSNQYAGDTVTLSNSAANFDTKNVGTAKPISVTGITTSGADAGNYLANTSTVTAANITAAALTVTATGVDKVYDGNTTAVVGLSSNAIAGDTVALSNTAANFINPAIGNDKVVNVTGITVTGTDASNYIANTTATTTASITNGSATPGSGSPYIIPIVPPAIIAQNPPAIQENIQGAQVIAATEDRGPNTRPSSGGVVPLVGILAASKANLLTVVAPPKGPELQTLYPVPVVAPVLAPKPGRN